MGGSDERLAFVFPGQGSQSVGMLRELGSKHPVVRKTFAVAGDALGIDLWSLVTEGPEQELNRTENTQPALLAASVAIWRLWSESSNVHPAWMAGHSLGEYSALVCADALTFGDALRLVRERGRLMQQAVPPEVGAMAAILGLDDAKIIDLCASVTSPDGVVSAANFNAPGQVVIAGHSAAVARVVALSKVEGAKRAVLLPVSVPSHCSLMQDAAARFKSILAALPIESPAIPVLHNVDVRRHESADGIRCALESQMYSAVRWSETVTAMAKAGVSRFIECGPGKVLGGLNKRIAPASVIRSIGDDESFKSALEFVQ